MRKYLTGLSVVMYITVCYVGIVNPLGLGVKLKYILLFYAAASLLFVKRKTMYLWVYNILSLLFLLWYLAYGLLLLD
jgi:hypothetical protein